METLTLWELVDLADRMTQDLQELAEKRQISAKDLLMAVSMAQKLLQTVLYPSDWGASNLVLQETDATYKAMSTILETN